MQTITFKLWDKTQFKCNGLFYWFEILWNITIKFLLFFICDVWPLQLLINNPVFYYNIFAVFLPNDDSDIIFKSSLIFYSWKEYIGKWNFEWIDFDISRVRIWLSTFRGHSRSNLFIPFENPYMTSYLTAIDTFSPFPTVFEIFDFKVFGVWPWPSNS